MPCSSTVEWSNTNRISFFKGPRIYYVYFSISNDGKKIKYGSTIYKNEGESMNHLCNHFLTAEDRFNRFPVISPTSDKIFYEMNTIKTRRSKIIFFESKMFTNFLIQNFVKYGVRFRIGKHTYSSLRKKLLDNRNAILSKKKRLIINKTKADILKAEKQRKLMIQGFNPQSKGYHQIQSDSPILPKIESHRTFNMVIWEQGNRIYHMDIQHNSITGEARYGACVFKSSSLEECQNYESEFHIDTAIDRFENFPILAKLPLNYDGQTSQKTCQGEFPLNKENMQVLKKSLCLFGVRKRNTNDNLLKKKEILQKKYSTVKKINKLQQKLDYDKACYKLSQSQKLVKQKKIVLLDTLPIILNKNKQIPTPPDSPRTQKIIDQVYQQNEKQKQIKGYQKTKKHTIQKRKAIQEYKKEKIQKERKNSEKTKEKQNRRIKESL